jgi:hypothetical protein
LRISSLNNNTRNTTITATMIIQSTNNPLQSPSPPSSSLIAPSVNILAFLSPALTHSLYLAFIFHRVLSTTTVFVLFRAYLLSGLLLHQSFYACELLLAQSYYATRLAAHQLLLASRRSLGLAWRATGTLRNKLFFEFMVFVLGGGNGIILVVFWPGWIVIGPGVFWVWWACG